MHDEEIRASLLDVLTRRHEGEKGTLIVEELALGHGATRVDIAVVNSVLWGYEIKSSHDRLDRLPSQVKFYSRVLDRVILVASPRWLERAANLVPPWWGLWEATRTDDRVDFVVHRGGWPNPRPNRLSVLSLLWKEEAVNALSRLGVHGPMMRKTRRFLWAKLAEMLYDDEASKLVCSCLKSRLGWQPDARRM